MIHTFKIKDTNIVVDVNSGAVHVVEDIVYDMLQQMDERPHGKCPDSLINALSGYPGGDILKAYEEIVRLCDEGLLFTEDEYGEIAEGIHRKPVVKAICLHVSHDCNLRCEYCFAGTGNFEGQRCMMDLETGKKAVDFVIKHSGSRRNIEIDFFGGEPLMNFDMVKELTKYIKSVEGDHNKNFRLTLTTNGVLLDEDKLSFINEHMSNLVLSIDGRPSVNDRMRKTISGGGSYDTIMPKLKAAANSRGQDNYYVRGTFTRHNLDFSKDVLHLADQGFRQISVEPVVGGAELDYSIKKEDLPFIFDQYEHLAQEYLKRWEGDEWFNFFHFMIDLHQGPCVIKRMSGCGAGCEYVAITPEGDIYPCHQFVGNSEFLLGNVHEGTFDSNKAQIFADANVYKKPKCKDCWAKFYCSGGCHANAYQFSSDINTPYEIGCEMEKKRVECALYIKAKQMDKS
ncbi:MAG: thioether cross-link-forming SCIFF peptide maturase, partial [Eubacteriales bacterium]|nr:thioether cross-link-forming SCIFF peptide maturase [Eubacteriales bacterium]